MGILISFSGIDGAGKSTQIKLISQYFKAKGRKVYVTEKMFGYFLFKPIIKTLRTATNSPPAGPVRRNQNLLLKFWFIPAFIDIWINHIVNIRPKLTSYDIVIADRFYVDIWANLLYYGYLPKWAFGSLLSLLPKANVPLMLSVKPKNVLSREKDFPPSYYREQADIYKKLASKLSYYIVDANRDKKAVFKQITKYL